MIFSVSPPVQSSDCRWPLLSAPGSILIMLTLNLELCDIPAL